MSDAKWNIEGNDLVIYAKDGRYFIPVNTIKAIAQGTPDDHAREAIGGATEAPRRCTVYFYTPSGEDSAFVIAQLADLSSAVLAKRRGTPLMVLPRPTAPPAENMFDRSEVLDAPMTRASAFPPQGWGPARPSPFELRNDAPLFGSGSGRPSGV